MDHVAIMKKSWRMIPKIIAREKTIESRWLQTRRAPWDCVRSGDAIYFKNTGERITASARVKKVLSFELKDISDAKKVVARYGKKICLVHSDPATWSRIPNYCVLVFLEKAEKIKRPFDISKDGFGAMAAWLSLEDIEKIKIG